MSSYSNNYYTVAAKTVQIERPSIPPLLTNIKLSQTINSNKNQQQQQQQQNSNSKPSNSSIISVDTTKKSNHFLNQTSTLTTTPGSTNRQKDLLLQQQKMNLNTSKSSLSHYNTNQRVNQSNSNNNKTTNKMNTNRNFLQNITSSSSSSPTTTNDPQFKSFNNQKSMPSNLANTFPSFYLNPNETNYTKLISSILSNKFKQPQGQQLSNSGGMGTGMGGGGVSNSANSINNTDVNKILSSLTHFKSSSMNNFDNLNATTISSNISNHELNDLSLQHLNSSSLLNEFNFVSNKTKLFASSSSLLSYRLSNLFNNKNNTNNFGQLNSSELQRREHISAKLANSQSNQSINSLHVNPLNVVDTSTSNSSNVRLNARNKSASNDHFGVSGVGSNPQTVYQQLNPNSNNSSTNTTNQNSLRISNSLSKNYIDLNVQLQAQAQNQSQTTLPQAQLINNRVQSSRTAYSNTHSHHHNLKIINDSNKFLEDILAHSKRNINLKSSHHHHSHHHHHHSAGQNQTAQSASSNQSYSVNSSIQLPQNVTIINRNSEERAMFPDKLIMDRKNLSCCPIIEGEDSLKLINYQHNQIRVIQNLDQMRNLIFLDLYDNRIERITGISNLINLRVLMLGKNRIQKIENLANLIYLDILDLHGNQISKVENLNNLHELRVLNIAANQIRLVDNLNGLDSLVELNLRRNQIDDINDLEHCTKLQRLFLSYNEIYSLTCIKNLNLIQSLQELTLDNNPICNDANYKRNVLAQFTSIRKFDSKRVTDEEKRVAEKIFLKEINKKREMENLAQIEEKRKLTIKDAENEWIQQQQNTTNINKDMLLSDANSQTCNDSGFSSAGSNEPGESKHLGDSTNKIKIVSMKTINNQKGSPNSQNSNNSLMINNLISSSSCSSLHSDNKTINDDDYNFVGSFQRQSSSNSRVNSATGYGKMNKQTPSTTNNPSNNNNNNSNSNNINNQQTSNSNSLKRSIPLNNGSNILEDNTMFFYGNKSLDIVDMKLEQITHNQVLTLSFQFIDYDDFLSKHFLRLRNKFPQANNLVFTCCNIKNLNQIDCMTDWKRLDSITINKEDNPICSISLWRSYLISRLTSLQLKKVNNQPITTEDLTSAQKLFIPITNWALQLPDYKLIAILGQDKKKLIKLAKENLNDQFYTPTAEQLIARETITKAVLASNQLQFSKRNNLPNKISSNLNTSNDLQTPISGMSVTETKPNQTKNLLDNLFSQMSYNDLKKKKINQTKNQIWSKFIDTCIQNSINQESHVSNLCKQYKIVL